MTNRTRNLTTTRTQVFGDVPCGSECRICGRNVEDGRSKTCSEYCDSLQTAVMSMLNWSSVRRLVIDRDDETCQQCGFDQRREREARRRIRGRIEEQIGERPEGPSVSDPDAIDAFDLEAHYERVDNWQARREELQERYSPGDRDRRGLEVDHIEPISEGGHPFDPGNLQTLCEECHQEKTARENRERSQTPSRGELSQSLFSFVEDDAADDPVAALDLGGDGSDR